MNPPKGKMSPRQWNDYQKAQGNLPAFDYPDMDKRYDSQYFEHYNPKLYAKNPGGGFINTANPKLTLDDKDFGDPYIKYTPGAAASSNTALEPAVQIDPNHKSLNIGPNLTQNPNTGDYTNSITQKKVDPTVPQYRTGGLVDRYRKGYTDGGPVTNRPDYSKAAGVANTAANGLALAGQFGSSMINNDPNAQGEVDASKAGWQGALSSAGAGAKLGGTLGSLAGPLGTVIGTGVGAIGGAAIGYFKGKDAAEDANKAAEEQRAAEEKERKRLLGEQSINGALSQRALENYADGGQVVGKGGPKDDKIKTTVAEGSFIVPAENAGLAKKIRKEILTPKVPVKLSNGEHVFDPEEVNEIEGAGVDLDDLAPNAKNKMNCGGLVKKYREGGPIKGRRGFNSYDNAEGKDYFARRNAIPRPALNNEYDNKYLIDPRSVPSADEIYASQNNNVALNTPRSQTASPNGALDSSALVQNLRPNIPSDNETDRPPQQGSSDATSGEAPGSAINAPADNTTNGTGDNTGTGQRRLIDANGILSNVFNYGVPLLQTALGKKYLDKAGKRPIGEFDPEYQKSIDAARKNLDLTRANAKFGFTAEEQAQINQDNANALAQGRASARNYSGGSAGNAYNLEMGAINNNFNNGLAAKVQNKQLQLQKQGLALNAQQYLDSLVAGGSQMKRNLYLDADRRYLQNQQAGAGLIGQGLSNLVGAGRYDAEMEAYKKRQNQYGQ